MTIIYLDGYPIERAFNAAEIAAAVAYWRAWGVVTTAPSSNVIKLY